MKTTVIYIKGFNMVFTLELKKKDYMSIEDAEKYVKREITNTAAIIKVVYFLDNGTLEIPNENYHECEIFRMNTDQYLKQQLCDQK